MQRRYRGSRGYLRQRTALAVAVAACFAGNFALANPTGPAVAQGQASFATQGNTLTVTNAPGTVINWQGFSIAGNEIARFIQQSQSSSVLNRVVGINPSSILGSLQSNGRVFLVNPNGITIGPGASIDVAGFMASTLNLSDADFLAGRMRFTPASGAGGVVNQGTITTAGGGMVYLVGQDVQNSGIIRSPQGEILLAAGKSVELVDAQTPEVRVQLTAPDNQALNLGQLIATGGRIGMYGTLVRNAGVASANTAVVGENGKIVFKAVNDVTLEAGSVTTASGTQAGTGGGGITIEGERIVNAGAVQVNAADQAAAGNIKMLAQRELVLGNTSRIEAKGANRDSSGGRVFLYSHGDATAIGGQVIDISGGLNSGNAGSGEFSAANMVSFGGTLLGSAAPGYARGSFLIDPLNFSFTGGTIAANTTVQAEDNITIDGNATINAGITLTLLADHDDNGGSPAAGVWDTGGGGTGTVGVGSITRSGNFTISGGAGSGLIMYAGGGGIGIGGSGAIQTDLNGGSLSVTINPAAVGAANVAVSQTSTNALSIAGIAAGSNAVALTAGGTIGQTGAISAGLLTTSSAGGTVLNGANLVGAFTASNTGAGNIELTNTIATLDIQGITQNTGDVIVGNTGAITQSVAGITTAADGNINLAASTALTTSQVVTAGGNGAVTLAGSNVVLGANVTGATVNIDATGAITRTGGVVTADTINLGVAGNTTAIGATGAGRIRVASTGGIASPAVDARATTGGVFIEQASGDLATSSYSLNVAGSGQSIELATTNGSIAIDHVAQWNANTAGDNVSLLAQGAGSNITAGGSTILTANDATLTATGGTVTLPATSLSGDLSVTAGGTIQQGSAFTVTGTSAFDSGGDVALGGVANSFTGTVTATAAGLVALRTDATPLELGSVSVGTGALTLQLGGDLTQATATAITKTGNGSVSVGANAAGVNVALGNSGNDFGGGAVTLSGLGTFNNVSVRDTNALAALGALPANIGGNLTLQFDNAAMTVPGVIVGGNLSLTATGIQQGGIFAVTGSSAFNSGAGGVALAGFDNSFGGAVTASASGTGVVALRTDATPLVLGNVSTGSAGLGLYLKGDVSQSGGTAITAGGPLYVEANAAGVTVALASATNDFNGGSITLATVGPGTYNNVAVRDTDASASINTLPASIGGDLTLQFDNAGITVPGVTVGGNLSLTAGGGIQQGGAFTVTGTSAFDAGGDVALAGTANSFTGTVTASAAGLVALQTGATALELGNVALSGTGGLTLQLGGDVTQAVATAITKTGNGVVGVQANVAGVNVALGNAGNDFGGGAVSLSGLGTFSNVSVRDTNAAAAIGALPASIGGDLTLQFDNAGITVPGVTVGGNVQVIAGGTINVSGNVGSTGTAALTTTSGNIALDADFGSSGAATTLTSAGNITQTVGMVSGTDVTLDSATGVGGGTGARVATVANRLAARSTTSGGVFVSDTGAVTLNTLSGVVNGAAGGGAYDVTAGGTLTVAAAVNGGVATGTTTLAATAGGNIVLGAGVGNTSAATMLTSAGNITQTAGAVSGSDVILDSVTGIGGGIGARVATDATYLAARSTVSGGVFVIENDAVALTTLSGVANGAAGGGAYDLAAGGTISVANAVNVSTATGSTSLGTSAGNIALAADVGNAGAVTTLVSAGDITRTAGTVIGSGVLLDAATAIGTGAARVSTSAGTLAARTGAGATGGIFITEADNVSIGTVSSVSGVSAGNGGAADVRTTTGDITLAADVSATGGGNVTLIAGGGAGNDLIAGAGRISTGSGLVTLQGDAVGTTAAPILTDLGTGTLAATSGAGDIAISNNTAAGLNSTQLTGFTTGGGAQTVSVAQTAGNLSLGGSLNVGTDVLVLGAAGDIVGNAATTLTASAMTLDAGGLIGGANAVNTSTSGTLTLNSGGTAAAGNITVSEAGALPVSRVSLGGSGAGTGRTVSLTSVAGPVTLDAAIGNAADHLTLVAAAGNIAGGTGTVTATNLTLNAAGGIGAGSALKSNTSGNLSLTTAGNAAAGDIALVETNALNTSRVTAISTTGTGTQAVSITSPSITLGAGIGNAADNLTLIAGTGTISGAATVTAKDLRLEAFNGIGATGTPVFVNTAGNLAAQLTNSAASSAIVISEVAAGAGMTVGTANGISGVTSTNNRAVSLAADSGNIVLNQLVNSGSGQIQLTTTGSGNVSVGATVSGGLVNISAAGTIADSAQITGTTLTTSSAGGTVLDFGHVVTGFNASNVTGGNIQLVNVAPTLTVTGISQNGGGDVLINNTGALTINGAISNAGTGGAINLTGSTGINLNQNLTATDGNITLNNATTLGANVQIAAGSGDVTLTGATGIGANNLTVSSSNVTTVTGGITGTTGNVDIAAATRTDVDGAIVLSGAGTVQLDRALLSGVNVTTAGGNITFDGAAATDTAPLQVGSGGGDVLFNNTLTLGSGAGLTVLSGAGTTTFAGTVTGPAALTVTASGNTVFSSAVGAGTALASLSTGGGGLTQINGAAVTTSGGQTYGDAVTLGADATLAGAGITFSNTLNSSVTPRTLQINDSATTTFSAAVGNTLGLASLTTNTGGATAINGGSLVTTGAQTYNDAVTLGVNTTLTGVDITFNNTLNSIGAARTLQINDSGTTTFGGFVGNTLALASLTTDTGGTTAINAASLDTTGAQTYNDAVTLGANTTLASSGGSDIRFVGTLDGPSGLTVNTAGNTIFSLAVGGTTPLASLTTDATGSTQVNGGAVTTVGAQTYNDGITITGPTTFNATATTATLDFNATLAAATHALTLSADEINFAGGAGSVSGSGVLTLQPNNTAAAVNIGSAAGATAGALDLAAADLAALGNGFSAINLGQAAGTHAITIGNAAFQDPLLVRTPGGGSVSVNGALISTENIAFNAGGAVQGGGSVTGPRVTFVAGGIGSLAAPLQLNTPDLDVQNSAGDAVMVNAGPVSLLNNFSNTAPGGELRLITSSGAIDTGVVAVQSAGGRIALIANDTAGGATGNIIVGSGGITSAGGDIALHAADNITIDGAIVSAAGNVRMLAGTGPGINAAHASFTGTNPPAPTEPATDDFGFITFNAPVSAANMVLVSSTSTTPTVVSTITQTAAGSIATTGALTAVTLRGAGAPGNGGGTIDLNDATGNNSTGLINLFACSFDGCPNALPTAPFVNQGAPLPPFTTAVYSDGQLFYSDVGGTDVTGIGTSGDFTLYTPGSVSITGPSLSAKNLTIEALVDINVNLLAPFTNNDINGGQPGGSLNFIAGQNVNYTSMVSGATIGTAAVPFNHDLRFQAAGNVTVANAIYVGAGNFVVRANEPVSLNNNTVNIPASGTGSVFMQGNHVVSSMGDLTVSGINLTVQGGDTGSANQSAAGQQLLSAGAVNLNLLGDVTVNGGTATGGSDSAAIIRGAVVNVGSAATPVANLSMTGGSSTVTGTTNHEADARIEGTTALNVNVSGDVGLAGGTAIITGTAGSSQKAGAGAILKGNSLLFSVAGNVTLTGGTANAATGGNTATANAQIVAGSTFNPVILGDLDLVGGSATAQPIAGEIANAVAGARFESEGDLLLKVNGNINLLGGNAVAINNTGGIFAEADASALVRSGAKVGIEVGQNFDITGGSAVATGSGIRAIGSAGVSTGDIAAGESLLIKTAGNMSMTGGSGSGAAADAAALIYSAAEAKLTVGGPTGLRLEGGTGPFFPPFSTGVFTPNSDLFHMIGGNALVRLEGSAYPITVTGSVTVVNNPALGAALFVSEAPPLSLDSLLAAFIKTTDCVSFSGGSCTLSGAVASGSGKGAKDPVGGVCK